MECSARSFDPATEAVVSLRVENDDQLNAALAWVAQTESGRGHPAIEFTRSDGSSLALAIADDRAYLGWTDSLGASRGSVGDQGGEVLIFDYFGSWSEVPAEQTIPLATAINCVQRYLAGGIPETEQLLFLLD